ncbi:hypothetical protein [Aquabacterium sp.]|jgi:hypothetical protein|uniref:hypothetical protein n=1 Tax=Aquabacterium sp. TaxID=1872578 RepID=UPI002634DD06|nr:hypothetical protein [Aquabacterium sp.]MDD2975891.1 hypothetical protein [Aquabacterium sp.]
MAGQHERFGILLPIGLVKVDGQEMACVVLQQWVDPHGVLARQVVVDHGIGQREQQTLAAIPAFDARLVADTRSPFIAAGGGIA